LVILSNFPSKIKIKNKIIVITRRLATWQKQTGEDFKYVKKSSWNFLMKSGAWSYIVVPKTKETMHIQNQIK
jgi:hypothetical protein